MLHLYVRVSEYVRKFVVDASGATAIEYGLIAAGISVAIIVTVGLLGDELAAMFGEVQTELAAR